VHKLQTNGRKLSFMAVYEIAVVLHPDFEADLTPAEKKINSIFEANSATVTKTDNWGKKKLAYPIKKLDFGIYLIYTVEMETSSVQKINNILNITDEVLRFLIVTVDFKKEAKADAMRELKAKKNAARAEHPGGDDRDDEK
jgi:small subunit ribosomal protein S6